MDQLNKKGEIYIFSNKEVAEKWGTTASAYQRYDACMQTGFYTLASMMRLPEAKSILEVACGTGRLLPYALTLKPNSCPYLATDISEQMVNVSRGYLRDYISKLGVKNSLETWLQSQNLQFLVHNGEQLIPNGMKFDRIICNFVLHLTQSPERMLRSLSACSEPGCLLGVTINGGIDDSNLLRAIREAKEELGVAESVRSYAHLHNRLGDLLQQAGWEVLACWEQAMAYTFLQFDDYLHEFLAEILKLEEIVLRKVEQKLKAGLQERRGLTLSAQLYVCRRK